MSSIKWNIIANFGGNLWSALMSFAFVPVYLRYIGDEGYGLVGFFASLGAILAILDGGLGAAAGRELAIGSAQEPVDTSRLRDITRTAEIVFWGAAVVLGALLVVVSPWLAENWINLREMRIDVATRSLQLLSLAFAVQWPASIYTGCLNGLQKQVHLNAVATFSSTLKALGAVAVLEFVSPTVEAFFTWQLIAGSITALVLRVMVWRSLPGQGRPRFSVARLRATGRFAAGVGGINILAMFLTQGDKVLLSKLLPLADFGRYTLAWTLAGTLYRVTGPVFNATYPRMTQLHAAGDDQKLLLTFRQACQLMAVILIPAALLLACFGEPLVFLWTKDAPLSKEVAPILALLAAGTMLNGIMHVPYGLQLAHGNTRIAFVTNVIAVGLLLPGTYALATRYGSRGAAACWLVLNAGYVLGMGFVTHRLFAPGYFLRWLGLSVVLPILVTLTVFYGLGDMARGHEIFGVIFGLGTMYVTAFVLVTAVSLPMLLTAFQSRFRDADS